jgi:transposase
VVESEELRKAAGERLERRLSRRERELGRELSRLVRETFACRTDAREATEAFAAEHLGIIIG